MPCSCWVRQPVYILWYLAVALYHWCAHKFYLHMTMSCGSQQNLRIAHAWHSALYLITVLTIQKATIYPLISWSLKTFPTKSFILSDPLTLHSSHHNSHFSSCSAVCPAFSLHLFNLIVFSLCVLLTHHSYHQLNFRSLNSSCTVSHLHYLLRLLTVTLICLKGAAAIVSDRLKKTGSEQ